MNNNLSHWGCNDLKTNENYRQFIVFLIEKIKFSNVTMNWLVFEESLLLKYKFSLSLRWKSLESSFNESPFLNISRCHDNYFTACNVNIDFCPNSSPIPCPLNEHANSAASCIESSFKICYFDFFKYNCC